MFSDFQRGGKVYGLVKDIVYVLCLVFIFGSAEKKQSLWQTYYNLYSSVIFLPILLVHW